MSIYPAVAGRHARLPHWMSIPALVIVFGLAATVLMAGARQQTERRQAGVLLDQRVAAVGAAIVAEANRYVDTLTDLSAAVGAQTELTAASYAAVLSGLRPGRLLGASDVSLVVPASDAVAPPLRQVWRDQGSAGLALTPGNVGAAHRFVVLCRTLDGSVARIGRDLGTVGPARAAMDLAVRRRTPIASAPAVLSGEAEPLPPARRQISVVVAAPVFHQPGLATGGHRGASPELRGWLVVGLRGQSFLTKTLRVAGAGKLAVELRDGDLATGRSIASWPLGRTAPVDQSGLAGRAQRPDRAGRPVASAASGADQEVRISHLEVAGRRWTLAVTPLAGPTRGLDVAALAAGTLISLVLAVLVGALSRSRDQALVKVAKAVAAPG